MQWTKILPTGSGNSNFNFDITREGWITRAILKLELSVKAHNERASQDVRRTTRPSSCSSCSHNRRTLLGLHLRGAPVHPGDRAQDERSHHRPAPAGDRPRDDG
jgi:hypothetical protein